MIRRFEYCLELAWKAVKTYLEDSGLRIAPVTPREVIRQAATAGVLPNGQVWIEMLDYRTLLAYTCDGVVQAEVIDALVARYFRRWKGCASSSRRGRHASRISEERRKAGNVVIGGRDSGLFLEIAPSRSRTLAQLTNSDAGSIAGPNSKIERIDPVPDFRR